MQRYNISRIFLTIFDRIKNIHFMILNKYYAVIFAGLLFYSTSFFCQVDSTKVKEVSFFNKLQYGGGIGLAIGNGFTNISLSPIALYPYTEKLAFGLGLQGSYVDQRNAFSSFIYGGSFIGLVNPIPELQLSIEVEQLRVNLNFDEGFSTNDENFWNTALFLGGGYRQENIVVGMRYNVLYQRENFVYSQAWMPFVRMFF